MYSGPEIHGFLPVGSQYGNFCSVARFFPRNIIIFDQNNWATYMAAMKEDKPPPGSNRHTKKSGLSTGAAYLARKTLVLTEEFFRVRYNEAI